MAEVRTGIKGSYFGSLFGESTSLTTEQMKVNATYITVYLYEKGWSLNAIAGMLGNMQAESSINPGRWQSEDVGNTSLGYGLVQWTPATKYLNWCSEQGFSDPSEMDNNLSRILYEVENSIQWIATDEYNLSFKEFTESLSSSEYLASAFLKCYERAGIEVEETRRANARTWYEFLTAGGYEPPTSSSKKKKKKFNFILFNRNRRIGI